MKRSPITPAQRRRRKSMLMATLITCIAAAMIGGSLHVMELGSMRLNEMQAKASYDAADMQQHIRAAGEELHRQDSHEKRGGNTSGYSVEEAQALLSDEQWRDLAWMITVPAGVFTMGSDDPRTNDENRPAHQVRMPAYKIDKYLVTQAEYARFVAAKKYRPPLEWTDGHIAAGMAMHPVTMISWYNARDYCAWVGKRLPTEAEWEKAARGTDGRRWPWGNEMNPDNLNTYYKVRHTTPVNQYPQGASVYGVMDMAGNVQQWVADQFAPYPGTGARQEVFEPKALDPNYQRGSDEQEELIYRVMRGGSWKSDPISTTSYHRNYALPNYASDFFGFRCAMDVEPAKEK
ncbi:formylglycine-generating enzyme family protein [Mariprofundus erugo]|uniref:Formylglycine-generating enzyme family protein n=1 Tax=Mariprofundus erugo TaxID=2528639 RepID=A0A5R9GI84_9PROT|nr:formylglycine-generating enzyme family protein [Mariprofundus erugo]TLS66456.1 formylglycine-generating enzyme family protein [Mariprofundus erugo]